MFIDEFATENDLTLVYYDEISGPPRYTFALLYDAKKSQYYVCTFSSSGFGLDAENIARRMVPVNTADDFRAQAITVSEFINSTLNIFAKFCDGEKSIGDAFDKLREPLLLLAKAKVNNDNAAKKLNKNPQPLPFSVHSKETIFPQKVWNLGRYRINVMPKQSYHQSHHFAFNLPTVVHPKFKGTAETNLLKITVWNGKRLVPQFTSANLLYFLNDLRLQYNHNHSFKGRIKNIVGKIKKLAR